MRGQATSATLGRPIRWRRLVAAAVVLAAATLTGCASYPGTAVRLDGVSLSQDAVVEQGTEVVSEASRSAQPDTTVTALHRQLLTGFVRHQLIADAARDRRVSVTDEQVNAFLLKQGRQAVASTLLVPMSGVDSAAKDLLTLQALVTAARGPALAVTDVRVAYDQVVVDSFAAAQDRVRQYHADPAALGRAGATTGQASLLTEISAAPWGMFDAAVGAIVVVPVGDNSYQVRRIVNRATTDSNLAQVPTSAASSFADSYNLAALMLAPYGKSAGIVVNPRYGVWDPLTVQVIPTPTGA